MEDYKKEVDDYFCRFTFGQFVTLILLEIVTLFFVFYLGARYGSDLLGTGSVAKKEGSVLPKEGPKSVDEIIGRKSDEYTYPEVLTGPGADRPEGRAIKVKPSGVTSDEYERQKMEDPAVVAAREPKAQAPVEAPKKAPPEPAREEPIAEAPIREEVPEETTATPKAQLREPKGKFTIQVGSYQSSQEATQTMNQWKKKGYQAFLATGNVPGKGVWYRVRIGGFATRDEASKYLEKLKQKEKASAIVVPSNS